MPVRAWISGHTVEGQVARRVEAALSERPREVFELASVEPAVVELPDVQPPVWSAPDEPALVESVGVDRPSRTARLEPGGRLASLGSRLGARVGLRLDPGRGGALAVGAAALVAVLVAGAWVLVNRPHAAAVASSTAKSSISASATGSMSATPAVASSSRPAVTVVVDVVGKVVHPGVYRLPSGSRVDDALHAAGGVLPGVNLATLNLARPISDGEQIAVAVPGAPDVGPNTSGTGAAAATGPVNLNTAGADQLDALPGVGPVLAQHIIAWRTQHGQFTSIDQLREVSGIGEPI